MPSFKIIGLLILKKNTFKGFSNYSHGGLGQVTLTINTKKSFVSLPRSLALIGHAVAEKMFKYYSHIHVYIPQAGADNHLGLCVFIK